jgi:hypothetical protein
MGVRQSFFTIILAGLGLSLSPSASNAIGLSTISSETELKALMSQPTFVAGGQLGSLVLENDAQANHNVDFVWSKGEKQPFSLSYDGSIVKYTVGEATLETQSEGFFQDLFIYTKATADRTSVLLNNLVLTDSSTTLSISGIGASSPNNEVNIFWIHDIQESFTLTGNAMLNWLNQPQNPNKLAYQIQVGNVNSVTASPNTNPTPADPINSSPPEPEANTGNDWWPWFPSPGSGNYCTSP